MKVDYFSNHIKADPTVRHAVASEGHRETDIALTVIDSLSSHLNQA